MSRYKLNGLYCGVLIFLGAVILLGAKCILMLIAGEVSMEDGPMDPAYAYSFAAVIALVLLSYLVSVLTMLRQLLFCKGNGLTLSYAGIEHTVVFVNVLAFIVAVPVRLIPWEAVTYYGVKEGIPHVKVDTKQVKASWLAKAILKWNGYSFFRGFCKPRVPAEEIEQYKHRFQTHT